jgi:crossover junction endodeoxyribonuclease RuvC
MSLTLRILGIDPGFDRTGFGVIEQEGSRIKWIAHGCIQTRAGDEFALRLQETHDGLKQALEEYMPDAVAVEQLFFQTNAKTAIKVGMARGVAILAVAEAGIQIIEATPNQIKQGIAGWGGADKKQVQDMVKRLLGLAEVPRPDDAADALAIAIVGATLFNYTSRTS